MLICKGAKLASRYIVKTLGIQVVLCFSYVMFIAKIVGDDVYSAGGLDECITSSRKSGDGVGALDEFLF